MRGGGRGRNVLHGGGRGGSEVRKVRVVGEGVAGSNSSFSIKFKQHLRKHVLITIQRTGWSSMLYNNIPILL